MVVCEDGRMKKSEYRKFRIRGSGLGARGSQFAVRAEMHSPAALYLLAEASPDARGPMAMSDRDSTSADTPAPAAAPSRESSSGEGAARDSLEPPLGANARSGSAGGGAPAFRDSGAPRAVIDDVAAMHEVVLRRYRKLLEAGGPFPDLILIDGGKGQLTAAYSALEELGLGSLIAAGIAKKEELLFTRDRTDAIALASESP